MLKRSILIAFLSCVALGASSAQQRVEIPEAAVRNYCQLDFDGARTSSKTFGKIEHMVLWDEEPGWDTVRVVRGFKIVSAKTAGNRATVVVEYDVVADIEGMQLTKKHEKERVTFRLKFGSREWAERNGAPVLVKAKLAWRITAPTIPPHISLPYAIQHVSSLLDEAQPDYRNDVMRTLEGLKAMQNGR